MQNDFILKQRITVFDDEMNKLVTLNKGDKINHLDKTILNKLIFNKMVVVEVNLIEEELEDNIVIELLSSEEIEKIKNKDTLINYAKKIGLTDLNQKDKIQTLKVNLISYINSFEKIEDSLNDEDCIDEGQLNDEQI